MNGNHTVFFNPYATTGALPSAIRSSCGRIMRLFTFIAVAGAVAMTGCAPDWERMENPDIRDKTATAKVDNFVAVNGWNMAKSPMMLALPVARPQRRLRGLPWNKLVDSTYPALTSKGILYVALEVQGRSATGVAYNPNTNEFPKEVAGFKALADHWYVWKIVAEGPARRPKLTRRYEGQN